MTTETPRSDRRTSLMFEIRYGRIACEREVRLFGRIETTLRFIELAGATAVVVGVLGKVSMLAVVSGFLLALIPIIGTVYDPRGKAFEAERMRERFAALAEEACGLDDDALERRIRRMQTEAGPDPVKAVRFIAYNDAVAESGLDPAASYELNAWQRFVAAMA